MNAVVKLPKIEKLEKREKGTRTGPACVPVEDRNYTRGVAMTERHSQFATELGGGNLSRGVRIALDMVKEMQEQSI